MSAAQQSESRKRSKKRYAAGHHGKRWKGSRELEVGMEGILITCNMNERKCTAEAFNLLAEYADGLYGPEKASEAAAAARWFRGQGDAAWPPPCAWRAGKGRSDAPRLEQADPTSPQRWKAKSEL